MNWKPGTRLPLLSALLAAFACGAAPDTNTPTAFQVKKGFRLETVAVEPLVFDPVALAFDADGRLFVAEDRDFPGPDPGPPHLGRVRLLEDSDGDGRFDSSKDFAEDLPAPSALFCSDNGVIVVAGMQVLLLKDTNGVGHASERRVLFTLSTNTPSLAAPPLPVRSLVWGLDNRIHAAAGGLSAASNVELNGHDFALDPRTGTLEAESGYGSTGVSFDNRGRQFVCAPGQPLRQVMWGTRAATFSAAYVLPPPLADLTGPASATPIFPRREIIIARTSAARRGEVHRVTDFFSAASSVLVYRGHAYPPGFAEDVFVADARANLIHRFKLRAVGTDLIAERPPDDHGAEFLASSNTWFRPMHLAAGPDGAIYVADLHREFVDAPAGLPDSERAAAARRRGNDQGRIYRIVPDNFKQPPAPRLAQAKTRDLVINLAHLNGWHRDTAARLLCEQNDPLAVPLLSNMVNAAQSPLARLHALAVLDGLGAMHERFVIRGLRDSDERVRQHAVRLATRVIGTAGAGSDALWSAMRPLSADPSPSVRYQLALALGQLNVPLRVPVLLEILRRDPESAWARAAVLNALGGGEAGEAFARVVDDTRLGNSSGGQAFLRDLAVLIGTMASMADVARVVAAAEHMTDVRLGFAVLDRLDEGLRRAGSSLLAADPGNKLQPVYQHAILVSANSTIEQTLRIEAIRLLGAVPFVEVRDPLFVLINPLETEPVQLAAVQTLGRYADSRAGTGLAQRWGGLSARVRDAALDALLAHAENADALFDAIQSGRIQRQELLPAEITFLRSQRAPQRANALFGPPPSDDRQEVVRRLLPALQLRGDAARGRRVCLNRCAPCHRLRGDGFEYGPDLEGAAGRGKEWLLTRFLDPNRLTPLRAVVEAVATVSAGSLLGVVENETSAGITLRRPYGERVALPRKAIRSITRLEVSAMPDGLEAGLTPEDIADLLEWLAAAPK